MAAARSFLALLLLTAATAAFAHADEGRAFDITTAASTPRKVLNGGSDGHLASAASQAVSALKTAVEAIESVLNINAPGALGASNEVKQLSGLDNFKRVIATEKKVVVMFTANKKCRGCKAIESVYADMSEDYAAVAFYIVDADAEEEIAASFADLLYRLPAVIAFKDGDQFGYAIGQDVLGDLVHLLERLVA
ncbi:hypothetical protein KFL_003440010 [Klebsormidium nitens]|uniref:Thioredoxin domain-containing protein n=1 Tax=Klebsormidium nitens TaxID=105231 RepID=A0A1Y1I8N4_KLENI|nr:hypothetical protein KFL_003440010 [Klebsormidium nitens]|eukprot:GAQ87300.1 hypothetical protein KFL_003440010 [Klebsormidium nitens]